MKRIEIIYFDNIVEYDKHWIGMLLTVGIYIEVIEQCHHSCIWIQDTSSHSQVLLLAQTLLLPFVVVGIHIVSEIHVAILYSLLLTTWILYILSHYASTIQLTTIYIYTSILNQ